MQPTRISTFLRHLARDRRGAAALEFALVSVPLGALMVAILQTSLTFFAQQTLETTAEKSVRQLMTGQAQAISMTQVQFNALVCSKLPVFMKCSKVVIDVQQATNFSTASTAAPTLTYDANKNITNKVFTPGGPGTVNVAKIMYIWNEQKGPLGFDLSNMSGGSRLLIATSVFKTEPYS